MKTGSPTFAESAPPVAIAHPAQSCTAGPSSIVIPIGTVAHPTGNFGAFDHLGTPEATGIGPVAGGGADVTDRGNSRVAAARGSMRSLTSAWTSLPARSRLGQIAQRGAKSHSSMSSIGLISSLVSRCSTLSIGRGALVTRESVEMITQTANPRPMTADVASSRKWRNAFMAGLHDLGWFLLL